MDTDIKIILLFAMQMSLTALAINLVKHDSFQKGLDAGCQYMLNQSNGTYPNQADLTQCRKLK